MKVLLIIPELHLGGTERQVLILAEQLARRGHGVRVVALRPSRRPFDAGLEVEVVTLRGVRSQSPRAFFALRREMTLFRPDVVHTFLFGFDLFANLAARAAGVPCILSTRRELATWRKRRHRWMQDAANLFVDAVCANSLAAAEYACATERFLQRGLVHTIPNAVTRPAAGIAARAGAGYRVLNIANFWPGKGQELLIRAFALFRAQAPAAMLTLVGEGPREAAARALASALLPAEAVRFAGRRDDILELLACADLYVHASEMESSPNAILEAISAGVPVVATACGGVPELLDGGDLGLLTCDSSAVDLAQAMCSAQAHPERMRDMAARARAVALDRHAPARIAEAHERLYARVTRARGSGAAAAPSVALCTLGDAQSPSARYRALQFVPALQEAGFTVRHFGLRVPRGGRIKRAAALLGHGVTRRRQLTAVLASDLCVIQKGLTPARWRGVLASFLRRRPLYVYDVDDAVHALMPTELPFPFRRRQADDEPVQLARQAAGVIAGNAHLARQFEALGVRPTVIPTVVEVRRYIDSSWRPAQAQGGDLRLIWAGQRSTLPYLVEIMPCLRAAAEARRPARTFLRVVCDRFDALDAFQAGELVIERIPWTAAREFLDFFGADVGLMPLPDDEWARAKCGFKLIQYMASGIPSMASPVGVNADIVRHGVNGILCATPDEWRDGVIQFGSDAGLRARLGAAARATIVQRYSCANWSGAFAAALRVSAGKSARAVTGTDGACA